MSFARTSMSYRFLFLKLNVWLCLASTLMVAVSALALSIPLRLVGVGFLLPPLLFYFIYVEERRAVPPEDEVNHPHRTALVCRHRRTLLVTEVLALLGYEGLLAWAVLVRPDVGPAYLGLGQLPILVLAAYGHLKRRPAFDSLAVGATWAFVIGFSLVVATPQGLSRELGGVVLAWFLIAFAGVEARNVPDAEGDAQTDRATLAGHLGRGPTTALVSLSKSLGVLVLWAVSGVFVAGLALGYLSLLRFFRLLTRREAARIAGPSRGGGTERTPPIDRNPQYRDADRL